MGKLCYRSLVAQETLNTHGQRLGCSRPSAAARAVESSTMLSVCRHWGLRAELEELWSSHLSQVVICEQSLSQRETQAMGFSRERALCESRQSKPERHLRRWRHPQRNPLPKSIAHTHLAQVSEKARHLRDQSARSVSALSPVNSTRSARVTVAHCKIRVMDEWLESLWPKTRAEPRYLARVEADTSAAVLCLLTPKIARACILSHSGDPK